MQQAFRTGVGLAVALFACTNSPPDGQASAAIERAEATDTIGKGSGNRRAPRSDQTIVEVDGGRIRGKAEEGVVAFKGIPFAEPPVGALRWRPPQPVARWEGIRDGSAYQSDCVQPLRADRPAPESPSEDCLYLNVWRPASASADGPSPVMVWFYGGALVRGGASLYPGENLARQGIVVVTLNYRLGRLGYFTHPALTREAPGDLRGNYGYMDQIAALEWVQRNIAAFGGDPEAVTIAGESAGGGSVLVHSTSPMTRDRGLFHRAIVQSPGLPSPRTGVTPLRTLGAAESIGVAYARGLGIEGDDDGALTALRAIPTETLTAELDTVKESLVGGPEVPGISGPILDGRLVTEAPEVALRAGRWAKVPVITGANDQDFGPSVANSKDELFAQFGWLELLARRLYDPSGNASLEAATQAVQADQLMVEPSRHLAELVNAADEPAYFYRFSYVAEAQREEVLGARHTAEIPYAFDSPELVPGERSTGFDRAMALTVSGYWVSFVKTGDPNGSGRPVWPPFESGSRNVLNFGSTGVKYGLDPLKPRLDLWRSVWSTAR